LMLAGLILAGWALTSKFGGVSSMFENVAKQVPALMTVPGPLKAWHYQLWFSYTVAVVLGSLCGPHMIVNMFVAKNPKIFKWSMAILAFPAFMAIPILLMGMGGRLEFAGLKGTQADNILPLLLMKYFPLWFAAFVLAGGMAAAMSTVDQLVIACSGSITRNLYPKSFKDLDPAKQVSHGRAWVLILSAMAFLIAITKPNLITVIGIWVTGCWMQIATAFFGILYWHRATKQGAFWGVLTGAVMSVLFTVLPPPFRNPLGFMAGFWGLLANIVVFYVVSVCTKPPSKETCERFQSVMLKTVES
jgi:SSS family solute:Na+ symporter